MAEAIERRDMESIARYAGLVSPKAEQLHKAVNQLQAPVAAMVLECGGNSITVAPGPRQGIGRGPAWGFRLPIRTSRENRMRGC